MLMVTSIDFCLTAGLGCFYLGNSRGNAVRVEASTCRTRVDTVRAKQLGVNADGLVPICEIYIMMLLGNQANIGIVGRHPHDGRVSRNENNIAVVAYFF